MWLLRAGPVPDPPMGFPASGVTGAANGQQASRPDSPGMTNPLGSFLSDLLMLDQLRAIFNAAAHQSIRRC